MKVMVFDVPASMGGALTILKSFYNETKNNHNITWQFVLSDDYLEETSNVTVDTYKWVKKSWLHRMFFDMFVAGRIANAAKPDVILSLQNVRVRSKKAKQVLYVHQPIPFSDIKYSIFKNPIEWAYKHLLGRWICRSARKVDSCIVQTKWMKDALVQRAKTPPQKVKVISPEVEVQTNHHYEDSVENRKVFFYPATCNSYKNHRIIIQAARMLISRGITDFTVLFTIEPQDIIDTEDVTEIPQIRCIGRMDYNNVLKTYSHSVLVFSSRLETFGLPLLEAALTDDRIVAVDKPFSREILSGYVNSTFFRDDDAEQLADIMQGTISGQIEHQSTDGEWYRNKSMLCGWKPAIEMLNETNG